MPGWRRNQRAGAPAAAPAVPPPAPPRDDWRALPPTLTVLRSPVTTVAVGAFRDRLNSWRDPSFLAPLSHQIDPSGPPGLITGLASPEPVIYYHDLPLPLAARPSAPVQRSAAPRNPSALMTAPDVDHGPRPLPAIPAGAEQPELTSTEPASAPAQEPPGVLAENPEPPMTGPDQPVEAPLVSHREIGPVTAQRQLAPPSPQVPPKRRLGLGAPLNGPPGALPAPAPPVPGPPLVARSISPPLPPDTASRTPHRLVLSKPASRSVAPPEHARPATVSVQAALASTAPLPRLEPPDPAPAGDAPAADARTGAAPSGEAPVRAEPAGDASQENAPSEFAPPAEATPGPLPADAPPAEAPLIGALPLVTHTIEPFTPPDAAASLPGPVPLPAVQMSAQRSVPPAQAPSSAEWQAVQRSVSTPELPPVHPARPPAPALAVRPATPAAKPFTPAGRPFTPPTRPPAAPEPVPASVIPDQGPAGQPARSPDRLLVAVQRLPSNPPVPTVLPRRLEIAPLLGNRPSATVLDAPPAPAPGPPSAPAPLPAPGHVIPDTPRGAPVQRSVHATAPASRPGGRPGTVPSGPGLVHAVPAFADPGAIAVSSGLAHREPDGSVVFDLGPAPVPPALLPPKNVQRQDASGSADAPEPSPGSEPPVATTPPPSVQAAATPPATGHVPAPASPPLDELARQLFGPLSAQLKAELRLDRERAGLLTDLRQ